MSFWKSIGRAVTGVVKTAIPLATQFAPTLLSGGIIPPTGFLSSGLGLLSKISPSLGMMSGEGSTGSMPDPGLMMSQAYSNPIRTMSAPLTSMPQEWDSEDWQAEEEYPNEPYLTEDGMIYDPVSDEFYEP